MLNILKKNLKAALLLGLFITLKLSTNAQVNIQWGQSFGGSGYDRSQNMTVDAAGNVYTTGYFTGTVDFDPSASTYTLNATGYDIFITKFSPAGNFIWAKQLVGDNYGIGMSLAIDATNNIILAGNINGTVDLDPSAGTHTYTSNSASEDGFVLKLDAAGNFLWAAPFGDSFNDNAVSVQLDAGGNIYTTGFFDGTPDFDASAATNTLSSFGSTDVFVLKLNPAGGFVWVKQLGGNNSDAGYGICVDASGNAYIAGTFLSTADFDPAVSTYTLNSSNFSAFVCKLNGAGNFVWAGQVGEPSSATNCQAIALDGSNNVYITGKYFGAVDFDPGVGTFTLSPMASSDIYIDKLDANGTFIWARSMGGPNAESGMAITTDAAGSVYTTGYFTGPADFDPGPGFFMIVGSSQTDIFLSKLDAAGNFAWAEGIGSFGQENGLGIAVDNLSNVFATGIFENVVDFDPGAGTYFLISNGNYDTYIGKYCQGSPAQPASINGSSNLCDGSSANYSIVPVTGATNYSWTIPGGWTGASATNTIFITPNSSSGNITVTANNGCGPSAQQTLAINIYALPTLTVASTKTTICLGETASLTVNGASTYLWNTGSTATSIAVSPTVNTTYSVTGTNVQGCNNTFTLTQFTNPCLGIKNNTAILKEAKLYPNPAITQLTIEMQSAEYFFIEISNSLGQILFTETGDAEKIIMNISALPAGLYTVAIRQKTVTGNYKMVKE